jgi:transposase
MAGRFDGLTDDQWSIFSGIIPAKKSNLGRKESSSREILNTILYVLISGCRWCDVPQGPIWGKRSTAHDRLVRWKEDGTLEKMKRMLLELAELLHGIDWNRGSVDGSFSPWKGRR